MTPKADVQRPRDWESALQLWAKERESSVLAHPSVDQLEGFRRRQLDTQEHEVIEEHLAFCSECATLLLELPDLLGETQRIPSEPIPSPPPGLHNLTTWLSRPHAALRALAASLVVTVAAVAWALSEMSRPHLDGRIRFIGPGVEIFADGARREEVPRVALPPAGDPLFLILRLPSAEDPWPREVSARVVGPGDRELYRTASVRLDHSNSLELSLGSRTLANGAYRVEIYEVGAPSHRMLARFRFEFARP